MRRPPRCRRGVDSCPSPSQLRGSGRRRGSAREPTCSQTPLRSACGCGTSQPGRSQKRVSADCAGEESQQAFTTHPVSWSKAAHHLLRARLHAKEASVHGAAGPVQRLHHELDSRVCVPHSQHSSSTARAVTVTHFSAARAPVLCRSARASYSLTRLAEAHKVVQFEYSSDRVVVLLLLPPPTTPRSTTHERVGTWIETYVRVCVCVIV